MILVQRLVHDGHLALAKGIVQGIVDVAGVHAQPRRGVPVNDYSGFQALVLLVGVDVAQFGQRAQLLQKKRRPVIQVIQVLALQRVLKLRLAHASADGEVLGRLHEESRTRHHRQFAAQPADHLVGADLAFLQRLQRDEHAAAVGRSVSAGKAHNGLDRGIFHHDGSQTASSSACMAAKEISCAACTEPITRPVSCWGKKPLGTMM